MCCYELNWLFTDTTAVTAMVSAKVLDDVNTPRMDITKAPGGGTGFRKLLIEEAGTDVMKSSKIIFIQKIKISQCSWIMPNITVLIRIFKKPFQHRKCYSVL